MTLNVKNPQFWVDLYENLDLCFKGNMNNLLFYKKNVIENFENFDPKSQNFGKFWQRIFHLKFSFW